MNVSVETDDRIQDLVLRALFNLREANQEPLPELPVDALVKWVKGTLPGITNVKTVAAALDADNPTAPAD